MQRTPRRQQLPFSSAEGGGGAHTLLHPVQLLSTAQWGHYTVCSPAPLCNSAGRHSLRGLPPAPTLSTYLTVPVSGTQWSGVIGSTLWPRSGATCWKCDICSGRGAYKHHRTWLKNQAVSLYIASFQLFHAYLHTLVFLFLTVYLNLAAL